MYSAVLSRFVVVLLILFTGFDLGVLILKRRPVLTWRTCSLSKNPDIPSQCYNHIYRVNHFIIVVIIKGAIYVTMTLM